MHVQKKRSLVIDAKGEMSFIGPRPERLVFNKTLEKEIPLYNLRHLVWPGFTGVVLLGKGR